MKTNLTPDELIEIDVSYGDINVRFYVEFVSDKNIKWSFLSDDNKTAHLILKLTTNLLEVQTMNFCFV